MCLLMCYRKYVSNNGECTVFNFWFNVALNFLFKVCSNRSQHERCFLCIVLFNLLFKVNVD